MKKLPIGIIADMLQLPYRESIEACAKSKLNASNEELIIALMRYGDAVSKIG